MSTRIGVAVMVAVLALYTALVAQRAWALLVSGEPLGIVMGGAILILPVLAVWAMVREVQFGVRATRLGREIEAEGGFDEEFDVSPSGRADRGEAAAAFPRYRQAVEAAPEDWREWYRLGLAYDGAGDRRRARAAIRTAIKLERRSGSDAPDLS